MSDDVNEVTELWRDYRKHQQERRAQRREDGRARLVADGIAFQERNGGAHLIVIGGQNCVIDYWPGTAKWKERGSSLHGRGCSRLLRLIDHRAKQMASRELARGSGRSLNGGGREDHEA